MGFPMAGHLARAGHRVTVWNRTAERAAAFVAAHGGRPAATPAEAVRAAAFAFVCTGDDAALREVAGGADGVLAGLAPGALLVDHTTASPSIARELAAAVAERGAQFLDAPVSGGEEGARNGTLTVMAGGTEAAFRRAQPLFASYARHSAWMGPAGSGQRTKLANQVCVAGLLQALAEGLRFAEQAGLDGEQVLSVISKGAAQSWQMDHRGPSMLARRFDFGFAVDWMRKDLGLALAEARTNGALLPVTALVDQLYARLQRGGGGRRDTSSLITLLD
jgi:3-hydroxyisobutyrate dehydrogenase-like beta-hydroxyacid dehydrogenase